MISPSWFRSVYPQTIQTKYANIFYFLLSYIDIGNYPTICKEDFSLELIRKHIYMNQQKCRSSLQMTLDDDFNVPDSKPDILRLLKTDGDIKINDKKQMNGKLLINGSLFFRILYISEDTSRPLHTLQGELPFSESINLSEDCSSENLNISWDFEDLTASIINSRKFTIRSLVLFSISGEELCSRELVVDVSEDANLYCRKIPLTLTGIATGRKDSLRIREELTLPNAKPAVAEILYYELRLNNSDTRLGTDKFTVSGDLSLFLCYLSDKDGMQPEYYETEIPVNSVIDCPGCSESMIPYITLTPCARSLEIRPDADGEERCLDAELTLDLMIKLYEDQELHLVNDLYSTRETLHAEYTPIEYVTLLQRNNSRARLSDSISLNPTLARPLQICHSSSNVKLDSVRVTGEGLLAEGVLDIDIFYISSEDTRPLEVLSTAIPFSQMIEIHGITPDCIYEVHAVPDQLSALFADQDTIELKAGISFDCIVFAHHTENFLSGCTVSQPDPDRCDATPSIYAYTVLPSDSLWDIAKRFSTSEAAICEINEITEENLTPGELLLIVKECSGI